MASPAWVTKAGLLSSTTEGTNFSLQLEVTGDTSDTEALKFTLLSGTMPKGLRITTEGLIKGITKFIDWLKKSESHIQYKRYNDNIY